MPDRISNTGSAATLAALLFLAFVMPSALAQNTGAVFSPVVTEGHQSMQYRAAYDPDSHVFAQRLHYQRAWDSRYQLGPFTAFSFENGWSLFAGALFGLTDATRDSDLRIWLTRRF